MRDRRLLDSQNYQTVRDFFGCGVPKAEFENGYLSLTDEARSALFNVAERGMLVLDLQHWWERARLSGNDYELFQYVTNLRYWGSNVDSLRSYLLVTCLDALTDKSLKVGKRLEDLFQRIPDATLVQLADFVQVFVIEKPVSDENSLNYIIGNEMKTKLIDVEEIRRSLYQFFFLERRNPYTHEARTIFPSGKPTNPSIAVRIYKHKKENKKQEFREINFKGLFAEALTLFLVAHSESMRLMDIPITSDLVHAFAISIQKRLLGSLFLNEAMYNSNLVSQWALLATDVISSKRVQSGNGRLRTLGTQHAEAFVRYFEPQISEELGYTSAYRIQEQNYQNMIKSVLTPAQKINSRIDQFEEAIGDAKRSGEDYERRLREFLEEVLATPEFKTLVQIPDNALLPTLTPIIKQPFIPL